MIDENKRYHFAQLNADGTLRIAFVGTKKELSAQIKKDFDAMLEQGKKALEQCQSELAKLPKPDLDSLSEESSENAKKWIFYKAQSLKIRREIKEAKCPTLEDGTYFILDYFGKEACLSEK